MHVDAGLPFDSPSFSSARLWSRVLVVEDDGDMRSLLADALRDEGYSVDTAVDGTRAVLRLFLDPGGLEDYDLILSDVRMPGPTGIDIASYVSGGFGPPVILLSAFATPDTVRAGVEAGAVEVVAKPFDLVRLMSLVRSIAPPEA